MQEYTTILHGFALVVQLMFDVSWLIAIFFGVAFFCMFYDAVFVDKRKYMFAAGTLFALCISSTMLKLTYPMYSLLGFTYIHHDFPCRLNGSFGDFLIVDETVLTPFYTECGIIGAGLAWQIWTSILPRASLVVMNSDSISYNLESSPALPFWRGVLPRFRKFCRKQNQMLASHDETVNLLSQKSSHLCIFPI